ncbi:MAG: NAD(P)-dependent oxidoreductase, partial [Streptosporangiaceae bacterium]
ARAVVLALALTPRTRKLISHAELAAMQRDAWLVNVARGPVVDIRALIDALRSGQIGGAALDVTDPEPLPAGHPCAGQDAPARRPGCAPAQPGRG